MGALLAHGQLAVRLRSKVFLHRPALQMVGPECVLVPGVTPPWLQDLALPLVELHDVPVSLFLQPIKVPLDGSMTFWYVSHFSQFCIILLVLHTYFALCPFIHVISDIKRLDPVSAPLVHN